MWTCVYACMGARDAQRSVRVCVELHGPVFDCVIVVLYPPEGLLTRHYLEASTDTGDLTADPAAQKTAAAFPTAANIRNTLSNLLSSFA